MSSHEENVPPPEESDPVRAETKHTYKRLCEIFIEIWTKDKGPLGEDIYITQRIVQSLIVVGLFLSLASVVRWIFGATLERKGRKQAVEAYVITKVAFFLYLIMGGHWKHFPQWVVWYLMADLLVNLAAFVLLKGYWKEPASGIRSLILLGFNFLELTVAFAVLYLQSGSLGQSGHAVPIQEGGTALYFSVITAATVGYGDILPVTDWGRKLITLQVFLSLVFVAVVVARFVSELGAGMLPKKRTTE